MGIFDKDIGQAAAPNYPSSGGFDPKAYRGVAAEGIAGLASGLGEMYIANLEKQKEAEGTSALIEYQSGLIDQENVTAAEHATQAENTATLSRLAAAKARGDVTAIKELEAKAEKIQANANQLGPGYEQRKLIERNLLKKRALNDPRLAGMQKEINTIFGQERDDVSKYVDPIEAKVSAIYGPAWTSADYLNVAYTNELESYQTQMLRVGDISVNRIKAQVTPILATRMQDVINKTGAMFKQRGNLLTDNDIQQAKLAVEQVYSSSLADVNRYLQDGVKQGYAMGSVQTVYDELNKARETSLKFFDGKDFTTRLKLYQETRKLLFEANMPDALYATMEVAGMGGGSGGELAMLSTFLQSPERVTAALGEDLGGVMNKNAVQFVDWMKKLQATGDKPGFVPGFDPKFQAFVGAPLALATPGTNDETVINAGEIATAAIKDPTLKVNAGAYLDSYVNAKATYVRAAPEVQQSAVKHFTEATKVLNDKLNSMNPTAWKVEDGKIVLGPNTFFPAEDYKTVESYNRFVDTFSNTSINITGATQWLESKRQEQLGKKEEKPTTGKQ